MSPRRQSDVLVHPDLEDVTLPDVLHALSDRTRVTIVHELMSYGEKACGTFAVEVSPSTLSHHFKVLREAGMIRQREAGRNRMTTLRLSELNQRFPSLVETILSTYESEIAKTTSVQPTRHDSN